MIQNEEDRSAVEKIYRVYAKKIFCIAKAYLHDDYLSEECVQDVFTVLIDKLQSFNEMSEKHQKNFLVKICRCIAVNKYREENKRNIRESSFEEATEDGLEIPDCCPALSEAVITEENLKRLGKILDEMEPKYGDILYMKAFMEMSNKDIAAYTGLTPSLVAVRLMRARKILLTERREELDEIFKK